MHFSREFAQFILDSKIKYYQKCDFVYFENDFFRVRFNQSDLFDILNNFILEKSKIISRPVTTLMRVLRV